MYRLLLYVSFLQTLLYVEELAGHSSLPLLFSEMNVAVGHLKLSSHHNEEAGD